MSFSVSFEFQPGLSFAIAEDTPQALMASLKKFGFELDINQVKAIMSGEVHTPTTEVIMAINGLGRDLASSGGQSQGSAPVTDQAPPQEDDPWGSEGSTDPNEDDPWGSPSTERPTNAQSASSGTSSAQGATQGVSKTSDRFGREYVMNLPGAKTCLCGEPAAKMTAKSQKTGNIYHKWVCARTAGENWRNKCDFGEFTK